MSNINVRIVGTASTNQMVGAFGKLQAQVTALNAQLAQMVALQNGVDPSGYERMTRAAAQNSKVFRNAAASTGMFNVEQMKLNSATDDYIKKLKARKMSFREMRKDAKIAQAAYKEQLAMEKGMMVRQNPGSSANGKRLYDVISPKEVGKDFDTAGRRMAMFNEQLKSGAHQMVNWGKNTQWAGRQLTVGLTMPILAFGAAAGVMAYQVDKEFTRIAKVYDTTANAASTNTKDMMAVEMELQQLRKDGTQTAIMSAREYGAAGKDTLNVQAELAATGLKGVALQKSTAEVMRISRLGEIEHQDAIRATISLQSVFRMSNEELTKSFNFMNSIENATSLQTLDFAKAIPIAAAPVKEFGGDIQELGILLTAMKERGIEATQGANAIKAAMQRLGRPSKQIREEWQALTGTDIRAIFENSDSLIDLFQQINHATENLGDKDRIKAFAGLFGSYQVTRMSALVSGMGDLEKGVGQVSTAFNLAQGDASDWAATADREIQRYQNSISGRWDTAFQEMKLQLATLGEPFVVIATQVVKGISKIIDAFNALPSGVKVLIAAGIAAGALAGVVLMLAGLMGNLAGNAIKGAAAILGLFTKMKILDAESRVAQKVTELATGQYMSQTTAVRQLTIELEKLTLAQQTANAASARAYSRASQNPIAGMAAARANQTNTTKSSQNPMAAALAASQAQAQLDSQRVRTQNEIVTKAEAERRIREKTSGAMAGAALSGAVLAGSMGVMMLSSNETAQHWAEIAMVLAIAVPAVKALKAPMAASAAFATKTAQAMWSQAAAAKATALAGGGNAKAAGMKGAAGALMSSGRGLIGPLGLATIAVGGLAMAYMHAKKNADELRKKQIETQKSLDGTAKKWAESAGKVAGEYERIRIASSGIITDSEQAEFDKRVDAYRKGDFKKDREAFEGLDSSGQSLVAQQKFLDLMIEGKMTAKEAASEMKALFVSTGDSIVQAAHKASILVNELGQMAHINWGEQVKNQAKLMTDALSSGNVVNKDVLEEQGKNVGEAFSQGFANSSRQGAQELVNTLTEAALSGFQSQFKELASSDMGEAFLTENHIRDAQELSIWFRESGNAYGELQHAFGSDAVASGMQEQLNIARQQEDAIIGQTAKYMGLNGEINRTGELLRDSVISTKLLSLSDARKGAQGLVAVTERQTELYGDQSTIIGALAAKASGISEEQTLQTINQMNLNNGFLEGETINEALQNLLRGNTQELENSKTSAGRLANELNNMPQYLRIAFDFTGKYKDILKSGMEGVQSDISDGVRDQFDDRMDASLDASQDSWDAKIENAEKQQDGAMEAFDARWEKRTEAVETYYDNRIDAIDRAIKAEQKAEEIRQRIFEAEQKRLQRLADSENRNIDFNVALSSGNLDEAAKIRNDMTSTSAEWALADAAGSGTNRSQRRIEGLEGRKENLQAQKEKELKALKNREEQERKHLQNIQKMRMDNLREQSEASMEANREQWENRKESLDDMLELFQSYTGRNEKDLRRWMKVVGISYDDFGDKVKDKGNNWSKFFQTSLQTHIRQAGTEIANDQMWEVMADKTARKMIRGFGFADMAALEKFIRTGKLPKDYGQKVMTPTQGLPPNSGQGQKDNPYRHTGGWGGEGAGSRKGVARTLRGNHPSEFTTTLRKGEFVVNEHAASKHGRLLESINNGGPGIGGHLGMAGLMSGIASSMAMSGLLGGMAGAINKRLSTARAGTGSFSAAKSGLYGNTSFSAEQLSNASTIASVGSDMGMSKRDIQIGIMTAITESMLRNVQYGDRDSLGLFQQRPSMGWGSAAQVTDPVYASTKFFEGLRGVTDRGALPPWLAAQAVQRSFDSTGGNYRVYWDEAQAIFEKMGFDSSKTGGSSYAPGPGGYRRPAPRGYNWSNTHDYGVPRGTPLYAVSDGTVVESRAITSGGSPGNGLYSTPYRSYGETVVLRAADGSLVRYAHMSPGTRIGAGQFVKGGTQIGKSGETGNAWGPHLHMDINGDYDAMGWLRKHGVSLAKGTSNVKWDNTFANLHKGEAVLTEDLNKKFHRGVENFANGGNNEYNVNVHVHGSNVSADEIVSKTIAAIKRIESRKPTGRRT